jgi:Uma2 family endonuclease
MATAALPSTFFPVPPAAPTPKRWTCAEFHRLGDSGWFQGRRAMLIEGEILEMCGASPPHPTATTLADYELKKVFPVGFVVRIQMPLVMGLMTDPEPDLAVVTGSARDYLSAHPTTALLVMEVSDSSLGFDTTDKANIYAAGNIADYWVVDLVNRQVMVFRNPQPDPTQPFGHGYASKTTYLPGSSISPLAAPQASIAVTDLLP